MQQYARERWGELPYVELLEIQSLDDPSEKKAKIAGALKQYPDHALLKLEEKAIRIQDKKLKKTELSFRSLFGERTEITPHEYVSWQVGMLHYFASTRDLAGIEALSLFNDSEIHTEHDQTGMSLSILYAMRISVLRLFLLES